MKPFTPPTFLAAHDYAVSIGFNSFDCDFWLKYNDARNWMIPDDRPGHLPGAQRHITNWKLNILAWYRNAKRKEVCNIAREKAVTDWQDILKRLRAGEHIGHYEVDKIPAHVRLSLGLSEDADRRLYMAGEA